MSLVGGLVDPDDSVVIVMNEQQYFATINRTTRLQIERRAAFVGSHRPEEGVLVSRTRHACRPEGRVKVGVLLSHIDSNLSRVMNDDPADVIELLNQAREKITEQRLLLNSILKLAEEHKRSALTPFKAMKLVCSVYEQIKITKTRLVDQEAGDYLIEPLAKAIEFLAPYLPKLGRFVVREHFNGFSFTDTKTDMFHWLSDGVDAVPDPDSDDDGFLPPGGHLFCALWSEDLNSDVSQTLEAYFPEQYEKEG